VNGCTLIPISRFRLPGTRLSVVWSRHVFSVYGVGWAFLLRLGTGLSLYYHVRAPKTFEQSRSGIFSQGCVNPRLLEGSVRLEVPRLLAVRSGGGLPICLAGVSWLPFTKYGMSAVFGNWPPGLRPERPPLLFLKALTGSGPALCATGVADFLAKVSTLFSIVRLSVAL
jgi:hypothetical protein